MYRIYSTQIMFTYILTYFGTTTGSPAKQRYSYTSECTQFTFVNILFLFLDNYKVNLCRI